MEIILTSFGSNFPYTFIERKESNPFFRMPPLNMGNINELFLPDYGVLLFFDKIILDVKTWEKLIQIYNKKINADESIKAFYSEYYKKIAEVLFELHDNGFVRLEDFDEILSSNKDLLVKMTDHDLQALDPWIEPLKKSHTIWLNFLQKLDNIRFRKSDQEIPDEEIHNLYQKKMEFWKGLGFDEEFTSCYFHRLGSVTANLSWSYKIVEKIIHSSVKRLDPIYKEHLERHLRECLLYVNSNLILSLKLSSGFYDWYDYDPFYKMKFINVGIEETDVQSKINKSRQLFEISFPEFTLDTTGKIVKILKDERIKDLRDLVNKAIINNCDFDINFANKSMREILKREHKIDQFRKYISWISMPLGFIPWFGTPLQKLVEESSVSLKEKKDLQEYRWFYLISEFTKDMNPS